MVTAHLASSQLEEAKETPVKVPKKKMSDSSSTDHLMSEQAPTAMTAESHMASAIEHMSVTDSDSDDESGFDVMSASDSDDELERAETVKESEIEQVSNESSDDEAVEEV